MSLASTTLSVTVVYLGILLVIGYVSYRNTSSTAEDYFMASRPFCTFVVAMSIFATNMTGVFIIGTPGFAYRAGIGMFGYMAVSAIMIVGFLAAAMSSIDAMLLTLSSIFTRDILARYTGMDTGRQASWGRILCVLVGAAAYGIALVRPGTIYAVAGVAMTGFALMVPSFAAALYWRRTTGPGVVTSLSVSGSLMVVFFGTEWLSWLKMGFMPIIPLLMVNIIVLVSVSLWTRAPSDEGVNKWFELFDLFYNQPKRNIGRILTEQRCETE